MIDYKAYQFWLAVAVALEGIVVGVYTWVSNRDKAQAEDIKEVKGDLQKLETVSFR